MPRNQGTSRKGKPKKTERASGMGRALMRAHNNKSRRKPTLSSTGEQIGSGGGMQPSEIAPNIGIQTVDLNADRKSILEMDDMADFLLQAEMANREFVSEKEQFVMVDPTGTITTMNGDIEESHTNTNITTTANSSPFEYNELSVPRRPAWTKETTPEELDRLEKDSFLNWRRDIAQREERAAQANGLHQISKGCVTPFEKNLEVWRQLWRVLESSSCIVLIVDARNPLFYISSDLKQYATEELGKPMLIVVNKSDYLTERQRKMWKRELCEVGGLDCVFFSAFLEQKKLDEDAKIFLMGDEENDIYEEIDEEDDEDEEDDNSMNNNNKESKGDENDTNTNNIAAMTLSDRGVHETLTRSQLLQYLALFSKTHNCKPNTRYGAQQTPRLQFGMVGFPNVGKSSVINVLMGNSKHTHGQVRVGVASQPGKTKHFQTLILPDDVPTTSATKMMLCDCPGLVFPSFVNSKADLIAAGVFPIEQMRDFWPVVNLVVQRVPRAVLNVYYGIELPLPPAWKMLSGDDGEKQRNKPPTGEELLRTYCISRSLYAAGSGQPHYQQASRIVIRDYVEGKLLYCHPPPFSSSSVEDAATSCSNAVSTVADTDVDVDIDIDDTCSSKEFEEETFITALQNTKKLREKFGDDCDAAVLQAAAADNSKNDDISSGGEDGTDAAALLAELDEHEHDDVLHLLDAMGINDNGTDTKAGRQREPKAGKKHRMKKPPAKKKGKRDEDPYCCHTDVDDVSSDAIAIAAAARHRGVVVSAGKYSTGGYTRLNYSGARAAVPHQQVKSKS